ncbi:MAG: DNA-binding protein [Myxococcales bacterium]|nr:DNA-binding protein [Myxococcales bacterium]
MPVHLTILRQPRELRNRRRAGARSSTITRREIDAPKSALPRSLPATRADCEHGERPCPYVSCRHHLYLDVTPAGSLKLNFPDKQPHELEYSCVLDLATGERALEEIAMVMNVTRERIRQLEERLLRVLEGRMRMARLTPASVLDE